MSSNVNICVFTAHGTLVSEPAVGYVNPDGTYTVDNLPASSTGYIVCAWTAEELTATPADRVSTCYGGRTRYETSPRHHAAIRRGAQNYGSRAHMTSASPCGWNYPRLARSCGSSNLKAIPLIAVSIFASRIASTGCSHLSRVHTRFSG